MEARLAEIVQWDGRGVWLSEGEADVEGKQSVTVGGGGIEVDSVLSDGCNVAGTSSPDEGNEIGLLASVEAEEAALVTGSNDEEFVFVDGGTEEART